MKQQLKQLEIMSSNYDHHILGTGNPLHPDNQDSVRELTPEQIFYSSEIDVPEHALIYIENLERRLKAKNEAIASILNTMQSTEKLTYYINELNKIYRL